MTIERTDGRIIGGYRVLRTLAHGDRAEILLGHEPGDDAGDEPGTAVALKALRHASGLEREVEALRRANGAHVVELLDVSSASGQSCLVLERLAGPTLVDLLERRTSFDAGEVVTILAPLAATLIRIHAAGVAHTRVSPASVVFRSDGAPVLTGFGAATFHEAGSPEVVLEAVPGVGADRMGMRELALLLLARVAGGESAPTDRFVSRLTGAADDDLLPFLAEGLFELAEARPVRFEDRADRHVPTAVLRHRSSLDRLNERPDFDATDGARFAWLAGILPDQFRDRVSRSLNDPRLAALRDRWRGWTSARRRGVLGAATALLTVIVVSTVLPSTTPSMNPSTHGQPAAASDPVPVEEPTAPSAVADEDPLRAAPELLRLRDRCLRDLSLLCLDGVDQGGSAALETDRALIRAAQDGEELPAPMSLEGELVLVERLGDSALVDLPPGAEVGALLLFRTEDGWRIRDYLPDVGE